MNKKLFVVKRIGIGLIVMLCVALVMDIVPNRFLKPISPDRFSYFLPLSGSWSALQSAVGALAGAYVAGVNFTGAAVLFGTTIFLFGIRILQWIAEPVESVAYLELLARNSVGFVVTIAAIIIGAEIGRWLSKRNATVISNAA